MAETERSEMLLPAKVTETPLVFISHDSRDGELAEAFAKLIKSVSAGMLKSFRSSDRKGTEGIEFGDEWYKAIMAKLEKASDVICLLTERSLDRPWLLYEAGVAKGKLNTPVHGLALGVPLSRASTGPFYQFQNSDDSEESLSKLILQICRRVPGLEPEADVVRVQVQGFRSKTSEVLGTLQGSPQPKKQQLAEETAVAKVLEEMKLIVRELPARLEKNFMHMRDIAESSGRYKMRRSKKPEFSIMDKLRASLSMRSGDPIGILLIASVLKDELPWFYEIGIEAYRSIKARPGRASEALHRLRNAAGVIANPDALEDLGLRDRQTEEWMHELPRYLDYYLSQISEQPLERPETERRPKGRAAKAQE